MRSWTQVLAVAGLLLAPRAGSAHPSGGPAVAWPLTPDTVGIVVDREYRFEWSDTNYLTPTTTITIDWFYTRVMPPTFQLGITPPDLEGTPIVLGIDEQDRTDAYVWNTSTVAPGSYWIWSRMNDLPGEVSLRINAFSRGVVTVAHPGDPIHPAIAMVTPRSPFEVVERETYAVVYEAFDPDGTGVVTLEAMRTRTGTDAIVIASDLPASRSATVSWTVRAVPQGDWILRARIRDGRGLESTAYARFVLTVEHPTFPDAGPVDGAVVMPATDAGTPDIGTYDAGMVPPPGGGCGCTASEPGAGATALALVLFIARRRRATRPASAHDRADGRGARRAG